jgi:FKBP-type peptidyl-prolyl cis-trans isomerase 2
MQIVKNTAVSIDYVLKGDDGNVIDESKDGQFIFLVGAQNIIPGLENALEGRAAGDELEVTVEAADAFGKWTRAGFRPSSAKYFPKVRISRSAHSFMVPGRMETRWR